MRRSKGRPFLPEEIVRIKALLGTTDLTLQEIATRMSCAKSSIVSRGSTGGAVNFESRREDWYAVQVRPRFEKVVAKHLQHKGYEEYLPLYRSRRRWSDRMKEVELPLFSGYIFCRFDIQNRLPILIVPGVLSIVGVGKIPIAVSNDEISSIRQVVQSGLEYEPWTFMKPGQIVSVERGPLAGLEGTVIEVKSNYRLILSVPLLQRSVAVEIDRDCVQAINNSASLKSKAAQAVCGGEFASDQYLLSR
jgi:transcription antitermination factor NusG